MFPETYIKARCAKVKTELHVIGERLCPESKNWPAGRWIIHSKSLHLFSLDILRCTSKLLPTLGSPKCFRWRNPQVEKRTAIKWKPLGPQKAWSQDDSSWGLISRPWGSIMAPAQLSLSTPSRCSSILMDMFLNKPYCFMALRPYMPLPPLWMSPALFCLLSEHLLILHDSAQALAPPFKPCLASSGEVDRLLLCSLTRSWTTFDI